MSKTKKRIGEQELVNVVLSRRIDKPMPLDTFEKIAISMAVVGVIGGVGALAYLIQSMP